MAVQKKVSVFAEDLRAMQETAAQAMQGYTPGGVRVPDGNYVARETCEMRKTDAGKIRVARTFVPTEGDYAGLQIWDGFTLTDNETGLQLCRRWVEQHNYEWPEEDLAQLEEIVNAISATAPLCRISVKTKGEYQNVRVQEVLAGEESAESSEPAEEPAEEPESTEDEAEPSGEESENDGLDALDRTALKKLINGDPNLCAPTITVTKKMSDDDIRAKIREVRAAASKPETAGDEPEADAEAEDNTDLLTFCAAQAIDGVNDSMSRDEIVKAMGEYDFDGTELDKDDIALLKGVGLGGCIKTPAPAKPAAAAKKTATSAPAKKPVPAPAKGGKAGKR